MWHRRCVRPRPAPEAERSPDSGGAPRRLRPGGPSRNSPAQPHSLFRVRAAQRIGVVWRGRQQGRRASAPRRVVRSRWGRQGQAGGQPPAARIIAPPSRNSSRTPLSGRSPEAAPRCASSATSAKGASQLRAPILSSGRGANELETGPIGAMDWQNGGGGTQTRSFVGGSQAGRPRPALPWLNDARADAERGPGGPCQPVKRSIEAVGSARRAGEGLARAWGSGAAGRGRKSGCLLGRPRGRKVNAGARKSARTCLFVGIPQPSQEAAAAHVGAWRACGHRCGAATQTGRAGGRDASSQFGLDGCWRR